MLRVYTYIVLSVSSTDCKRLFLLLMVDLTLSFSFVFKAKSFPPKCDIAEIPVRGNPGDMSSQALTLMTIVLIVCKNLSSVLMLYIGKVFSCSHPSIILTYE